ncbi:MAG: hypothetical protein QGI37_04590 [Verrucomicrobiota bacterium]|jgi:hypothetical protein|nr:hypothetical protein [Verrucomicrobiota bacterium]MDP6251255.1 hypothetical protein [Verrucomicrobiota bacterium]MDP7291560.1 hypothetical protein [Verrucomicrobiota bacterium]MDP7441011.1 hypothetical protein [Verrucomicrobiota bacterium]HJN82570.1 hypothetical protein [Verrucomicrobiota bacterium]
MKTTIRRCAAVVAALSVLIGAGLAESPAKLSSVDVILKRNIEALGGEKAMRRLKNRETRGKIELTAFGVEMPVVMRQAAPNKEMMELTIEGLGTIRDVFTGRKGWTKTPDGNVTEKKEREVTNKKIEADFYTDLNFKKNYPDIAFQGMEQLDGKRVFAVKMTPKKGDADTFYFDTETGLVAGVASTAEIQGREVATKVLFRDYKTVDGVQIPYTLELKEPSFAAFMIRLESVKHNVKADADWFKKTK